ncbi:MAG: hypothetical protein B7Z81_15020 [Acidocella sp. 20-61-6]|nr:MAG: hypothetical protein B7Z81_15020 [Acidocella sp. 20-61-6]
MFEAAEPAEDIAALCTALAAALGAKVSAVVASSRLSGSPAMLVADKTGPDLAMQRLMRRAGRPVFGPAPRLEINPAHGWIKALASQPEPEKQAELLLDLARLQEGDLPENPAEFVKLIAASLSKA